MWWECRPGEEAFFRLFSPSGLRESEAGIKRKKPRAGGVGAGPVQGILRGDWRCSECTNRRHQRSIHTRWDYLDCPIELVGKPVFWG